MPSDVTATISALRRGDCLRRSRANLNVGPNPGQETHTHTHVWDSNDHRSRLLRSTHITPHASGMKPALRTRVRTMARLLPIRTKTARGETNDRGGRDWPVPPHKELPSLSATLLTGSLKRGGRLPSSTLVSWPKSGQGWPTWTNIGKHIGQRSSKLGQHWHDFGNIPNMRFFKKDTLASDLWSCRRPQARSADPAPIQTACPIGPNASTDHPEADKQRCLRGQEKRRDRKTTANGGGQLKLQQGTCLPRSQSSK